MVVEFKLLSKMHKIPGIIVGFYFFGSLLSLSFFLSFPSWTCDQTDSYLNTASPSGLHLSGEQPNCPWPMAPSSGQNGEPADRTLLGSFLCSQIKLLHPLLRSVWRHREFQLLFSWAQVRPYISVPCSPYSRRKRGSSSLWASRGLASQSGGPQY